jgi:hypothetical protein
MSEQNSSTTQREEYTGPITLPGGTEPHQASLVLDREQETVTIRFDTAIAGSSEWKGTKVRYAPRLKYHEFQFMTSGLPKERVDLTWKFNASLLDDSLAGVIIPRPNDQKVSGEKGFVLNKRR